MTVGGTDGGSTGGSTGGISGGEGVSSAESTTPVSQIGEQDPLLSLLISTLSKSDLEKMLINLYADGPVLNFGNLGNVLNLMAASSGVDPSDVTSFLMTIEATKSEIISDMLDKWAESIAEQKKQAQEKALQDEIIRQEVIYQERQGEIAALSGGGGGLVKTAAFYEEYLRQMTPSELAHELGGFIESYVKHSGNDLIMQNEDIAKAGLGALMVSTVVASVVMGNMLVAPVENMGNVSFNPIIDSMPSVTHPLPLEIQVQVLPQINLFVMEMATTTTLSLYIKQVQTGQQAPDTEFAKNFAEQILAKVKQPGYIEGRLLQNIPGLVEGSEELFAATMMAKLFALTSALALFDQAETQHNLTAEELRDMLSGEYVPEGREELIAELRTLFDTISGEQRFSFASSVLEFLEYLPDSDQLTQFHHVLSSATQEVFGHTNLNLATPD